MSALFRLAFVCLICTVSSFPVENVCEPSHPVSHSVPNGYKILQAQVINRHGDRAPASPWYWPDRYKSPPPSFNCNTPAYHGIDTALTQEVPKRLYRTKNNHNISYPGNCILGQLTSKGADQTFRLGQRLREIYVDTYNLLPGDVSSMMSKNNTIWFAGDCSAGRCVQSLESIITGFYPPSAENATVIPIMTASAKKGDITASPGMCSNIATIYYQTLKSNVYQKFNKSEGWPIVQWWAKHLGITANLASQAVVPFFIDWFPCLYCHQHPFPTDVTLQRASEGTSVEANLLWDFMLAPEVGKTNTGPLFEQVLRYQNGLSGSQPSRYIQWSGHDLTIVAALSGMGVVKPGEASQQAWPPYASTVSIETWESGSGEKMVRALYQDKILPLNCGQDPHFFCTFSEFESLVKKHADVDNWRSKCTPFSHPF